jgi:hypothetical protein
MVSVPLSLIPNVMIAATLARRRLTGAAPKAVATGALGGSDEGGFGYPLPQWVVRKVPPFTCGRSWRSRSP